MENDERLILNLLNIRYEDATDVKSVNDGGKVSIYVTLKSNTDTCLFCGSKSILSNGYYSRKVKVPNEAFNGIDVYLKIPRKKCNDCHKSFSEDKHLAPKNHQVSYGTIISVMNLLKNPSMTFKEAARINNISTMTVIRIFDKHCHIPRLKFPEVMCIDEVYIKDSSAKSKYSCIFYDFFQEKIVDIIPSRHKNHLSYYLNDYVESGELNNVRFICIDMYKPYKDIAKRYFKKAIICADSFHVVKHLNDDLNGVRIRVMNSYDTSSVEYYLLKNFRYLLFDRTVNLDNDPRFNRKLGRYLNKRDLLNLILSINEDLYNGFYLKEMYMNFNIESHDENIEREYDNITGWFIKANIPEYDDFISILTNWKEEILNSFTIYKGRRINNSVAEGLNSQVKTVMYNSRGIYDSERRRKRIMYAINKDGFALR